MEQAAGGKAKPPQGWGTPTCQAAQTAMLQTTMDNRETRTLQNNYSKGFQETSVFEDSVCGVYTSKKQRLIASQNTGIAQCLTMGTCHLEQTNHFLAVGN